MKSTTLLLLLLWIPLLALTNTATIQQHLFEVNPEWAKVPAFTSSLYDTITIGTEQEKIQLHLSYVLQYLNYSTPRLPASQMHYRAYCLQQLSMYMHEGVFPENRKIPHRNPCFIDDKGTYCAVGYLLKQTGYDSIAQDIKAKMNYAYINEIPLSYISAMADKCGFTTEELALIQPSYAPYLSCVTDTQYTGRGTANYCRVLKNDEILHGGCADGIYPVQLSTIDSPLHGSINLVFLPNDTFYIYQPDTGYTGIDSFHYSLLYGPGGSCAWRRDTAAVIINIVDQPGALTTFIPGDGNYDGKLDNMDVLNLAKSIGQSGNLRAVNRGMCVTNYCTPWLNSYMGNNLAACDADGNGSITNTDLNGILSCFNQPYMVNFEDTTSYKLIAEPYDTIINPGDSIYINLRIERYGTKKDIKAIAMVLELPGTSSRVNLHTKQLQCKYEDNNPDIQSNNYAISYDGQYRYIHTGFFNTQNVLTTQQLCTPFDSFTIVSIPIPDDSINSDGLFSVRIRSVYVLDMADNIVPVIPKTFVFRSDKTSLGTMVLRDEKINLYPNPANQTLTITNTHSHTTAIRIYNVNGELVSAIWPTDDTVHIPVAELNSGLYIAEIETTNGLYRKKWVKY